MVAGTGQWPYASSAFPLWSTYAASSAGPLSAMIETVPLLAGISGLPLHEAVRGDRERQDSAGHTGQPGCLGTECWRSTPRPECTAMVTWAGTLVPATTVSQGYLQKQKVYSVTGTSTLPSFAPGTIQAVI